MPNRVTRTATPKGDGPATPPQMTAKRCAGAVPEWLLLTAFTKQTEVEVWRGGSGMVVFEIGFQHEGAVVLFVARGVDEGGDPVSALLPQFVDHVLLLPEFRTVALFGIPPTGPDHG